MCCWIKFKCQDTSFSTTDGTPGRASPGNAHVEAWKFGRRSGQKYAQIISDYDRVTGQKMQKCVVYSSWNKSGRGWQKYVLVVIEIACNCILVALHCMLKQDAEDVSAIETGTSRSSPALRTSWGEGSLHV